MTMPEIVPNPEPHPDPRGSVPGVAAKRVAGRGTPNVKPSQRGTSAPPPAED